VGEVVQKSCVVNSCVVSWKKKKLEASTGNPLATTNPGRLLGDVQGLGAFQPCQGHN
jgi:hypothetical protein